MARRPATFLAAVGVLVVGACGANVEPPDLTFSPRLSPTPAATAVPSPTTTDEPSPAAWTRFTSVRHGFSLELPSDWTYTPATTDWPPDTYPAGGSSYTDQLAAPAPFPVIDVVTQPLPAGTTADAFLAWLDVENARICTVEETEEVTVDGVAGRLQRQTCGYNAWEVALIGDGRVTLVYWLGIGSLVDERRTLDRVLSTFRFGP